MNTSKDSLKILVKTLISRLENNKWIAFDPATRASLVEAVHVQLSKDILTEEDINEMARHDVAKIVGHLEGQSLTESDAYRSQKRSIKEKYSENEVNGFFLKRSLRQIVLDANQYIFNHPLVEDVFESDDVISSAILKHIQVFDETKVS